jgi:hypothetical protein
MRREWVFDPANGYALAAFRLYDYRPPFVVRAEILASDFRMVGGLPLPFAMSYVALGRDGVATERWEAKVIDYILHGQDNTPEHYHVPWHDGMRVIDRRTGIVFEIVRDGQLPTGEAISPPQLVRPATPPPTSADQADSQRRNFPYVLAALLFAAAMAGLVWHRRRSQSPRASR